MYETDKQIYVIRFRVGVYLKSRTVFKLWCQSIIR